MQLWVQLSKIVVSSGKSVQIGAYVDQKYIVMHFYAYVVL